MAARTGRRPPGAAPRLGRTPSLESVTLRTAFGTGANPVSSFRPRVQSLRIGPDVTDETTTTSTPTLSRAGDSDRGARASGRPRLVKRYANRKLYDTQESRYVTLSQVAAFVRAGEDVQIIDNRTKENLTEVTLAQIVFEERKSGRADAAGRGTLQGIIRQRGEQLMTSLRETPREILDELQRLADERVRGLLTLALGHVEQLQGEVGRLHARIEELEGRLARRGAGREIAPSAEPDGSEPPETAGDEARLPGKTGRPGPSTTDGPRAGGGNE